MNEVTAAWILGCAMGFLIGSAGRLPRDRDPDWRRSFNHKNTNRPSGSPPLLYQPRLPVLSMNIIEAINVMESVAGVTDESTSVGEAWAVILSHIMHSQKRKDVNPRSENV